MFVMIIKKKIMAKWINNEKYKGKGLLTFNLR